ncbi:KIR protein [Plasmodium coatneyi]|uniref:KIR protein n=1 Tax=Plasmodium coatneyi TaxID=208452 RepID=A0A1B1E659_9APIC|nr:KIR protein [Plasmodium coatneyi]ANQ10522.1 KIR protein [Plasmodium coatneyi]
MTKEDQNHCNVNELPSQKIYHHFKNNGKNQYGCDSSWSDEIGKILVNKLKETGDPSTYGKEIAQAYCIVSKVRTGKEQACSTICNFFYYWLGDKLHNNLLTPGSFKDIMEQICDKLKSFGGDHCTCRTMHTTFSKDIFPQRKTVFDYYYDYRTVWRKLKNSQAGSSSPCRNAYDTYINGATTAYGPVSANCPVNGGDEYCTEIVRKIKDGKNIPRPSELKEKALSVEGGEDLPPETKDETNLNSCLEQLSSATTSLSVQQILSDHSSSPQEGNDSGSDIVTGVVTSAVGTLVGLPVVSALLYKVIIIITTKTTITISYLLGSITNLEEGKKEEQQLKAILIL